MTVTPKKAWSLEITRMREAQLLYGDILDNWGAMKIAQLDTGVHGHPALGDWVQRDLGCDFLAGSGGRPPPVDPMTSLLNAGHGTRTATVLTGWDPGVFAGAAPQVPVVPYRVSNSVVLLGQSQASAAAAIHDAIDQGCQVVTISLGTPLLESGNPLGQAVDRAYDAGVIICAAGGQFIDRPCYPGKFFRTIGVGGYTGWPGAQGIYISYGNAVPLNEFIDVWGPADPVWRGNAETGPEQYGWGDGTSFATPHVAATAALWLSLHREELQRFVAMPWVRIEMFRYLLKTTAMDLRKAGFSGFDQMRPATAEDGLLPRKGNPAADGKALSGGLDVMGVLTAPLPDRGVLRYCEAKAVSQTH